jgi:hypothetical protein
MPAALDPAAAYAARRKLAQDWRETMKVLCREIAAVEEEARAALIHHVPSVAAEAEADDRIRNLHERELQSSMRAVRTNPRRLIERADETNSETLASLNASEVALGSVVADVDRLLAFNRHALAPTAEKVANALRRAGPTSHTAKSTAPAAPASSAYRRDIEALDQFVEDHGGASLGWHDDDHAAFQRYITTLSAADVLPASSALLTVHSAQTSVAAMLGTIPDDLVASTLASKLGSHCSFEDVRAHVRVYREYLTLVERKRLAVTAWKDSRRVEKLHADRIAEIEQARVQDAAASASAAREQRRLARHHETSAKVREWKEARADAQHTAAMEETARRKQLAIARELQRRMDGAMLTARVEANRQAQAQVREVRMLGECVARIVTVEAHNASLKHRRDQDRAIVEKRKQSIEAVRRPASADPGLRPRSATSANAHRDASRLTAPTQSSTARTSSSDARVQMTRGPNYLTPRGNHLSRAPATWCGLTHMR